MGPEAFRRSSIAGYARVGAVTGSLIAVGVFAASIAITALSDDDLVVKPVTWIGGAILLAGPTMVVALVGALVGAAVGSAVVRLMGASPRAIKSATPITGPDLGERSQAPRTRVENPTAAPGIAATTRTWRTTRWWVLGVAVAAASVLTVIVVVSTLVGNHFVIGGTIHTLGGQERLEPCTPLPTLQLSDLNTSKAPTCDLSGARIEVSSGKFLTVPDGLNMITEVDNHTYGIANLGGDLGVVVYTNDQQWGNIEAVRLVRRAGWTI